VPPYAVVVALNPEGQIPLQLLSTEGHPTIVIELRFQSELLKVNW
jgi:hypothetical protein